MRRGGRGFKKLAAKTVILVGMERSGERKHVARSVVPVKRRWIWGKKKRK